VSEKSRGRSIRHSGGRCVRRGIEGDVVARGGLEWVVREVGMLRVVAASRALVPVVVLKGGSGRGVPVPLVDESRRARSDTSSSRRD
jgi:hypothetical protein